MNAALPCRSPALPTPVDSHGRRHTRDSQLPRLLTRATDTYSKEMT